MLQAQIENYLLWQEERGFIWPAPVHETSCPVQEDSTCESRVAVVCDAQGQEFELLSRMLAAIDLDTDLVTSECNKSMALSLIFGPPPPGARLGEPVEHNEGVAFYTYHPKTIIKVPEVKPIAWNHLQAFATQLKEISGSM